MSALSAAKAILEADATLLATATGGVWDFDETKRLGLSRTTTPAAFNNGIIKPAVLLKLRSDTPDNILADDANQYQSTREMLEVWLYEDAGFTAIATMSARVRVLLHAKQLAGTFMCYWAGSFRPGIRDDDLDANVERSDFVVHTKKSGA
jgi:hypothetical protein